MSKLTDAAINPTNFQKQRVPLALQVFVNKQVQPYSPPIFQVCHQRTLLPGLTWSYSSGRNCKSKFEAIRLKDPDRAVIDHENNHPKNILNSWVEVARAMTPTRRQAKRVRSFTYDTGEAIQCPANVFWI